MRWLKKMWFQNKSTEDMTAEMFTFWMYYSFNKCLYSVLSLYVIFCIIIHQNVFYVIIISTFFLKLHLD